MIEESGKSSGSDDTDLLGFSVSQNGSLHSATPVSIPYTGKSVFMVCTSKTAVRDMTFIIRGKGMGN